MINNFVDLHDPSHWNLGHVQNQSLREEYQSVVSQISSSMNFMEVIGAVKANGLTPQEIKAVDIFMSHEALMLDYEGALCRKFIDKDGVTKYYVASSHYLWVGDRTRQLDCAHIEFLRGVVNPIGIKVGPTTVPEEMIKILDTLNPNKEIGKISLITRFGANKVETYLPKIIEAVQESGHIVVWVCDPMHGNTESSVNGLKTRHFDNILKELGECLRIHKNHQSKLNGVHFELTGDSVTECIGGSMQLESSDLPSNYQTYCDPRLNYEQSLDMSFMISKYFEKERSGFNTL
jgi:3-deoxy-7-phosphoheptulonate synthase